MGNWVADLHTLADIVGRTATVYVYPSCGNPAGREKEVGQMTPF